MKGDRALYALGILANLALGAIIAGLVVTGGCYPKTCAPNDTSCWPCTSPGSTNPACVPPLHDERPPK